MALLSGHHRKNAVGKNTFVFNALIGEGGFGVVLSGMCSMDRDWYAVKEINKHELLQHKTGLNMILGELQALQKVRHSFIVGLQSAFHDEVSCYLVLDLKCGGDLRFYLRKKLSFEERDVAFYVACISSALAHIHSIGIMHRDVKPENIILDERGYPHLTDFGVAYVEPKDCTDEFLTSRLASGTKQYLAPEVFCKGHIHGRASDFWSLGVTAYELLYSERPFEKHCPKVHIHYLEEALKRTDRLKKKAQEDRRRNSIGQLGEDTPGAGRRGSLSGSPVSSNLESTSTSFSTGAMNTATSMLTSAVPTMEAMRLKIFKRASLPGDGPATGNSRPGTANQTSSPAPGATGIDAPPPLTNLLPDIMQGNQAESSPQRLFNTQRTPRNSLPEHPSDRRRSENALAMLELPSQVFERAKLDEPPADGEEPKEEGREKEKDAEKGKEGRRLLHCTLTPAQRRLSGAQDPSMCTPPGHPATTTANATNASSELPSVAREPGMMTFEHWTVDEDLPIHLRVQVPHSSRSLSHISPACVNVMESFFEVRPGLRFGTDLEALRNHPWFSENEIPDWSTLETKMYCPNFVPEKRFMQNTFWSPQALRHYREMAREDELNASRTAAAITAEEEQLLAEFDYNSPYFESLIERRRRKSLEPGGPKGPMTGGKPLSPTSGQMKPHMAVSCSAPALHPHQQPVKQTGSANKQTLPKIAF